jgi:hypothetical protein
MKQFVTIFSFLFIVCKSTYSQRVCASTFNPTQVQQVDNARYQRFLQLEQHITNYRNSLGEGGEQGRLINPNSVITIPVVVHVIHTPGEAIGGGQNISVAQIQSQIDVLNEDFRRLNPDRVNTPNAFVGVAADPSIEFRLACQDPNGNPTNGITRTASTVNAFSVNDDIKFTSRGGHDAWPTVRYLNIWVGNLAGGLLGYAQFPFDYATRPNTDGVVIRTTAFGRVGNVVAPFNTGRTATHEVGHWLGLFHIWGDDGGSCNGSDQCNDTPNQADENFGCPAFPSASCSNNADMSMNYMDYTDDACMNIFTNDQRIRMRAIFTQGGPRAAFINNYFRIVTPVNPICGTSGTVTVINPNCLPVTWTVVSGPAIVSNGQGTNTATIQRNGNGSAVVRATAGDYIDEIEVTLGLPLPLNQIDVYQQICGSGVQWWLDPNPWQPNTVYNWTFTNVQTGVLVHSGQSVAAPMYVRLYGDANSSWNITVTPQNGCGFGTTYSTTWGNPCPDDGCCVTYRVSTSPNPAKDELIVKIDQEKEDLNQQKLESIRLELIDFVSGSVIKRWTLTNGQAQYRLNVADVKKGRYVLSVMKGKYRQAKQVLIEK